MGIKTIMVGGPTVASFVVLETRAMAGGKSTQLPIRIGPIEALSISAGVEGSPSGRPLTHELLGTIIDKLGASVSGVCINDVRGTTFFAQLFLIDAAGSQHIVDCRPSDAIALAVRKAIPIFAEEKVLSTATMPDFAKVEAESQERDLEAFHDFVENLSPEDFL